MRVTAAPSGRLAPCLPHLRAEHPAIHGRGLGLHSRICTCWGRLGGSGGRSLEGARVLSPAEADQSSCSLPKHIRCPRCHGPNRHSSPRSPFPHWPRADGCIPEAPSLWPLAVPLMPPSTPHFLPTLVSWPARLLSEQVTWGSLGEPALSLTPAPGIWLCLSGGVGGPMLHPGTLARAWEPSCYWTHSSVLAGLGWPPGPWSFRSSQPDPLPPLSWAFRPRGRRDWEAERSPRSRAPIAAELAF